MLLGLACLLPIQCQQAAREKNRVALGCVYHHVRALQSRCVQGLRPSVHGWEHEAGETSVRHTSWAAKRHCAAWHVESAKK